MKKLEMKEEVKQSASSLIGVTWRCYYNYIGKKSFCKNIRFWNNVRKFRNHFMRLKNARKALRNHIIDADIFDRFIVENDLIRNDINHIHDTSDDILDGARKLNSQLNILMNNFDSRKSKVPKQSQKKKTLKASEISLDKIDCIFGSMASSRSDTDDLVANPNKSPLKSHELDCGIDQRSQLEIELDG